MDLRTELETKVDLILLCFSLPDLFFCPVNTIILLFNQLNFTIQLSHLSICLTCRNTFKFMSQVEGAQKG